MVLKHSTTLEREFWGQPHPVEDLDLEDPGTEDGLQREAGSGINQTREP